MLCVEFGSYGDRPLNPLIPIIGIRGLRVCPITPELRLLLFNQFPDLIFDLQELRIALQASVRGRPNGIVNTPFNRPGRELITATRSARYTASLI